MILTFKIKDLETLSQVKQELNLLAKTSFNENETFEEVILTVCVANLSANEFMEPTYDFCQNTTLKFKLFPNEDSIEVSALELDSSEILMGIVDDLVFEELLRFESREKNFSKRNIEVIDWDKFEEIIFKATSLDSLYHKIKHDESWNSVKPIALYKILLHSNRILDLDLVYDFIDNFFEIRFADLILKYNLKKSYVDKIINDPNINPVVLFEYQERFETLESVEQILATEDSEVITNYFSKLMKRKTEENINHALNEILNYKKAPEEVIRGIISNYDIDFLYDKILSHPNCPTDILEKYLDWASYGVALAKNPNMPSYLLEKMANSPLGYDNEEKVLDLILNHINTLEDTKKNIKLKKSVMATLIENPSEENLHKMINSLNIKFSIKDIMSYAKELQAKGLVKDETITIIEESLSELEEKISKKINNTNIGVIYKNWGLEKTTTFIRSSASEEDCTLIYKQEIENSNSSLTTESPLMAEISSKFDNLLKFELRSDVISKIKEQAKELDSAKEIANNIINNVNFLSSKFQLSAEERKEIVDELVKNQSLDENIKEDLNRVS